jgi:hypothetical protein
MLECLFDLTGPPDKKEKEEKEKRVQVRSDAELCFFADGDLRWIGLCLEGRDR